MKKGWKIKVRHLIFYPAFCLGAAIVLTAPAIAGRNPAPGAVKKITDETITLGAVTVTAHKRETNLQEVAAGITHISDRLMADGEILETEDLIGQAPNLHMIKTGNHSMAGFLSIRGITGWMGGEPTVGFYVDDVYYSNFDTHLLDVERVEILRGPQGTLYGRNTEAGVINIVSRAPTRQWEGYGRLGFGNYNSSLYAVGVSGPVVRDKLAIRLAARRQFSDGFFENTHTGNDSGDEIDDVTTRFTMDWTPVRDWEIRLNGGLMKYRDGNSSFAPLSEVRENPHKVTVDYPGLVDYDGDHLSLRLNRKGKRVDIIAVTAVRNEESIEKNDMDFSSMDMMRLASRGEDRMLSQEIRLASPKNKGPFEWLTGFYYFSQDKDLTADVGSRMPMPLPAPMPAIPPYHFIRKSETETRGYAFFGQGTYTFFDRLRFTLGLRYDHENKDFRSRQYYTPDLSAMGMVASSESGSGDWNEWLPKFSLDYAFTPDFMAYASVSRGYKSGGFNSLAPAAEMSYDPEYTVNYELGVKSSWLEDTLVVNLALFHIDWTDQQIEQQRYPQAITKNSGKSRSRGFEVEAKALPARGVTFTAGIGYAHAEFKAYTDDLLDPVTHAVMGTVDYAGNRIPNVPGYNFHLAGQYRNRAGLFARLALEGVGDVYYDSANSWKEEGYEVVNAKLGWEWENFQAYLWGKNIFDTEYATRSFEMQGRRFGRAGDPAIFGITFEGRF